MNTVLTSEIGSRLSEEVSADNPLELTFAKCKEDVLKHCGPKNISFSELLSIMKLLYETESQEKFIEILSTPLGGYEVICIITAIERGDMPFVKFYYNTETGLGYMSLKNDS